ncbi:ribosomal protein S18 [Metamycoplasma cloacale]|uniref:Small ribosomal subunit protein bS18 n=1 Tax=Metamycoplasma cloacale TaxID=92401 RepID=A0A2Z4LL97_9BACT|nr:30S ribosomal protein S18 [Metamycoplasma cloacale]AWX42512.1 30S ribosomal protein S18 [Metamycoplasma cloacale]VEU79142.1 ribosomal protein S18 [Metamycoplasma cloacale]
MARVVHKKPFVRRRPCQFCLSKSPVVYVDYKNDALLSKLVNMQGKILSSRITGTCAKHQRAVSLAIKRARYVAILPYIGTIARKEDDKPRKSFKKEEVLDNKKEVVSENVVVEKPKRTRKSAENKSE